MNLNFRHLRNFYLTGLIVLCAVSIIQAQDNKNSSIPSFSRKHQVGARIGAWVNLGDEPPSSYSDSGFLFTSDIGNADIYGELFFGYRIIPHIMFEISIGTVNRGTVTLYDSTTGQDFVGNLYINPVIVEAHIYPLASVNSKLQPWISGGGGLYVARRSVQFVDLGDSYGRYNGDFSDGSQTKFGYVLGGGIDYVLGNSIALEASTRWMPISFSEGLALVDSYDALSIMVGIKYLLETKKK